MTTAAAIYAYLLAQPVALNDEGRAPRRIHLLPPGPVIRGRDGRTWRLTRPQALVDAFAANGAPIPVDYEHGSMIAQNGEARPAAGWIESIEIDGAGVWGNVTWTPRGEELVANREYRFISPAFTFDERSHEISALRAAGLVHHPNLHLTALNSRKDNEDPSMIAEIVRALGLPETATAADAVVAINTLRSERQVALNAAQHPPADRFVPIEQHTRTVTALNSANTELDQVRAERAQAQATALVDDAVRAGKIAPASRESYLALALNGFDAASAVIATLPVIVAPGVDPDLNRAPPQGGDATTLTPAQIALCRQLGISEQDYLATTV